MNSSVRRGVAVKTRRRRQINIVRIAVLALVVLALFFAVKLVLGMGGGGDTFYDGVYVNGTSLAGYTYEQGVALVNQLTHERLYEESYQLVYGDKAWTFTAGMLGASMDAQSQIDRAWNFGHVGNWFERKSQLDYLKTQPLYLSSEVTYDEAALDEFIAGIKSEIDYAPVSATVIMDADEILHITDSATGLELEAQPLKEQLVKIIVEGGGDVIELHPTVVEPEISKSDMQSATELVVEYSTPTTESSETRTKNIASALNKFNCRSIQPGETISFNEVVGKRTEENGFFPAPEYAGNKVVEGIGGGTCQASTTIYGAMLMAGCSIDVRYSHGMTVGYMQPSLDAAVTDTNKDLVFTNDNDFALYIYTSVDREKATVTIYGKPTEYRIELESVILEEILPTTSRTRRDNSGKYVYYATDPPYLYSQGKSGARSKGYRLYYDRQTGELVKRDLLSTDSYYAQDNLYLIGVHDEFGNVIEKTKK